MFEFLYEWLRNLAFYLVLVTAVLHILPSQTYKKYIRFFTGLVLILMLLSPIFNLFGMSYKVTEIFEEYNFEKDMKDIGEEIDSLQEKMNQEAEIKIGVEEIIIGP